MMQRLDYSPHRNARPILLSVPLTVPPNLWPVTRTAEETVDPLLFTILITIRGSVCRHPYTPLDMMEALTAPAARIRPYQKRYQGEIVCQH